MAILRFSKWRPSAILDFKNLQFLSCSPCRHACLLPHAKFRWNRTIGRRVIAKKAIFKVTAAAILNLKNFNFWSRDCHAVVYQIFFKSHNFSLRYGDLAIFKMAAVRHLGFVMTSQYCIAGHIFVVQILSWNFMLIGFVVSGLLAMSYVALLAVHNGQW